MKDDNAKKLLGAFADAFATWIGKHG